MAFTRETHHLMMLRNHFGSHEESGCREGKAGDGEKACIAVDVQGKRIRL